MYMNETVEFKDKYGEVSGTIEAAKFRFNGYDLDIYVAGYNSAAVTLNFEAMEELNRWLEDCIGKVRENCSGCHHERDGCQIHG